MKERGELNRSRAERAEDDPGLNRELDDLARNDEPAGARMWSAEQAPQGRRCTTTPATPGPTWAATTAPTSVM